MAGFAKIFGCFSDNLGARGDLSTTFLVSVSLTIRNELAW